MKANAFALSLVDAASVSFSWIVAKARDLASSLPKLVSMRLALKRRLVGSSTSDSGLAGEEVSGLIPKQNGDYIEPEARHTPFQHQEPAQEHSAFLVPIEKEIIAVKSLTGTSSSTGPTDAPRKATDVMASLVAGAPVSRMDVPPMGNESPVKARSRKHRRHRKPRRRPAAPGQNKHCVH